MYYTVFLAFDEKSTFDYFALSPHIRRGFALYTKIEQNNQNWFFHRKLTVATSERGG
jgi:hypothetical protein